MVTSFGIENKRIKRAIKVLTLYKLNVDPSQYSIYIIWYAIFSCIKPKMKFSLNQVRLKINTFNELLPTRGRHFTNLRLKCQKHR